MITINICGARNCYLKMISYPDSYTCFLCVCIFLLVYDIDHIINQINLAQSLTFVNFKSHNDKTSNKHI